MIFSKALTTAEKARRETRPPVGRGKMFTDDHGKMTPLGGVAALFGVVFVLWLIVFAISWAGARATPQGGQIGVVRSGSSLVWVSDWFNGHQIKQVIKPGSGSTYIGLGSETHWYPNDGVQRNYKISANPNQGDQAGVDVVQVPTSDGVNVGLEGTFFFTTAFNGSSKGEQLVKDFDTRFGVRTFTATNSSPALYPWQDGGWEAFLAQNVRPLIDNDLRRSIASVTCAQLVSSCALVHSTQVSAIQGGSTNNATIQSIQDQINKSLQSNIASTLGQDYFSNVRFLIQRVTLPTAIQSEIDKAQAQYAAVGSSLARVQQAKNDAQANVEREKGFKACPACAQASVLAAIPSNVTTFAPGGSFAVTK